MNKKEMAKLVSEKTRLKTADCINCINAITQLIKEGVRSGESINIKEFGSFCVKYRKEKYVYNLATREPILIDARKVPVFKPTGAFKKAINS